MESAWTRDGRVKADVVTISADVAGTVTEVLVHDNQLVQKGDVLFVVDKARYQNAVAQSQGAAGVAAGRKGRHRRKPGAARGWTTPSSRPKARKPRKPQPAPHRRSTRPPCRRATGGTESGTHRGAGAGHRLRHQPECACGRFAAVGAAKLALINSDSFYVVGYFEETKLPLLKVNDKVDVHMMSGGAAARPHRKHRARHHRPRCQPGA
jgi:hypothetical protein